MSEQITTVRKAIDNIISDVMQKAYHHSINYPQDSDYLNKLIRDISSDNETYVNQLHQISTLTDEKELNSELQSLSKDLKRKSLVYLSELQKLQERDAPRA